MLKKIYELFDDREVELKERLFRVVLVVGSVASLVMILANFALENALMNIVPLVMLIFIMGVAWIAAFKYHKVELAAVLIGVLIICGIFPYTFFICGGIMGGATVWFVLGILYIFMMFSGKRLLFFLTLVMTTDILTYLWSYYHPEWIVSLSSRKEMYYDSLFSVLVVGITVGGIMKIQLRIYEKERKVALTQKEELERISSSKDNFFSYVSHEIRTPINTIIGLNEMILRENTSEEVAEDAQNVLGASKVLLSLVNDILDMAKIESKKMEIVQGDYHIRGMISELVRLVSVLMKEKKLDFIVDVDEKLPSVLYGDEKRIKQVITNLLTNAVKYTENGSITFSVKGENVSDSMVRLEISVADTGVGIKREELKDLFDIYKRVDLKKNHKIEGSGLGLSIVKQLVDLMGGEVGVNSIYGKGSIFTVKLEQQIMNASPVGTVDYMIAGNEEKEGDYRQSFEAPEARILIVDDVESNLMVACKLLRATKVKIDTARNGRECLEYTRNEYYHVILLDDMMPEMDGIETLQEIRRQENGLCREVPVVVLTANNSSTDEKRYFAEGFDGYLSKPVDGKVLEAEILKFLPEDVVEYRDDIEEQKYKEDLVQKILGHKRKRIIITSDCISDLPKDLRDKYDIRLMYTYIVTEKGEFRDTKEIGLDNFSKYLSGAKNDVHIVSAPVEEYETFFAEILTGAENVIHVSVSSRFGKSYENAALAAKEFYHVNVIDSGHASGGEGLLVLYAANLAKKGYGVEEICHALEKQKDRIEGSFLLPTVDLFYKNGYINKMTAGLFRCFGVYPVIKNRGGRLILYGVRNGRLNQATKRYIGRQLLWKKKIDTEIVYITHIGCTVEQQREILKEVKKYITFNRVIMQRGSVSVASSMGFGVIGIAYALKDGGE